MLRHASKRLADSLKHDLHCAALADSCALASFQSRGVQSDISAARTQSDTMFRNLKAQTDAMVKAGTYKNERVITSPQGPSVSVDGLSAPVLNFCSNNYLGLSNHPRVLSAAREALDTHGFGLASARFICGTQDVHKELERTITRFHGSDDTILYPSCFDANAGLFESILTSDDAVLSDSLNHASIIDGIRLCKAKRYRYDHMCIKSLEGQLEASADSRVRLIATDGVFSMDGNIAPLKDIVRLARKHDALVFVDECHATGFVGATGRGTDEYCGVRGEIDIINSTLGKALGGATGGYTTGRADVVQMLRQKARPYLFSNTLAPVVAAASIEVLKLLEGSTKLRNELESNTTYFRTKMLASGFNLQPGFHPIVPIMLGDEALASQMASRMLEEGIYVIGFSYPVVPKGQARVRVQISAAHEIGDLDAAIAAFVKVGSEMGVIG